MIYEQSLVTKKITITRTETFNLKLKPIGFDKFSGFVSLSWLGKFFSCVGRECH